MYVTHTKFTGFFFMLKHNSCTASQLAEKRGEMPSELPLDLPIVKKWENAFKNPKAHIPNTTLETYYAAQTVQRSFLAYKTRQRKNENSKQVAQKLPSRVQGGEQNEGSHDIETKVPHQDSDFKDSTSKGDTKHDEGNREC